MTEATEHHEIVLEVESELRGLRKAFDLVTSVLKEYSSHSPHGQHYYALSRSLRVIQDEVQRVQITLNEITEDDDDE